ncbi:MAG: hypothetical protein AAGB01_11545 [Cyanobacteria bacterium P01_F01_bin.42]
MKFLNRWWRLRRTITAKWSQTLAIALALTLGIMAWSPVAEALTPIKLENLSYHDCPEEFDTGAVNPGGKTVQAALCVILTGTAVNDSSKPIVDADIFGRIYDADNNPAMQNRNRLGAIPYVPQGESEFELRVTVPGTMKLPLRLDKFKASGFASSVGQFGNVESDDLYFDEFAELEE